MNIAIALVITLLAGYAAAGSQGPVGWAVAAAIGLPLALRKRWPISVLALVLAAVAVAVPGTIPPYAAAVPIAAVAFAAYAVGELSPRRRALPALAAGLIAAAAIGFSVHIMGTLVGAVAFAVPAAAGLMRASRREKAARDAEALATQAVHDERLRIARELHDVVAHSLSLIAVQAGVANHVAKEQPAEAQAALKVIESASRQALDDMRRSLGVLRADPDSPPELYPVAGLDRLGELAEQARLGGVTVAMSVQTSSAVPQGVQLSVYRIVQEALTNVVKHAAPTSCQVTVVAHDSEVCVEVTDNGSRPPGANPHGHGLLGMRERALLYGGSVIAAPRPAGGFTVTARIPYDSAQTVAA